MLMKSLTHVRRQDEIVLVLFIHIIYTEAFSRGIGESSDDIVINNFVSFIFIKTFYFKWSLSRILNSVVVVDSLICELLTC